MTDYMHQLIRFVFVALLFASCSKIAVRVPKEQPTQFVRIATVRGIDITRCGCCGGWIIYVDDERYLGNSIPGWESIPGNSSELIIDGEIMQFPVTVKLNYSLNDRCGRIDINSIQRL